MSIVHSISAVSSYTYRRYTPKAALYRNFPHQPLFELRRTSIVLSRSSRKLDTSSGMTRKQRITKAATTTAPAVKPVQSPTHKADLDQNTIRIGGTTLFTDVTSQAHVSVSDDFLILGFKAKFGPQALEDFVLGKLKCKRWLACARNKLWWMTPEWGTDAQKLPPETQFLLAELDDGNYAIALPLIDQQKFRGTIRPPSNGAHPDAVTLRIESGSPGTKSDRWEHSLLIGGGSDPYALIESAVGRAAQLSGDAKPLREKRLPPTIDVFGWCSWDSFYSAVSAQGLVDAIKSLQSGGAPPQWVIIDDGWQSTDLDPEFKTWEEPLSLLNRSKDKDGNPTGTNESSRREGFIEGETEVLAAVAKAGDIPAGSATGVILQEVLAAEDQNLDSLDMHTMAQQHGSLACSTERKKRPYRNPVIHLTGSLAEYIIGLAFGVFQALILVFYQWVVDPAAYGSWPVSFFAYLVNGPLRKPMLQFYADQTIFTRRLVDVKANSKFHAPDATADEANSGKEENLAAVVAHLKTKLNVKFVYCWHGLSAYWSGIAPDSPCMEVYKPQLVYADPTEGLKEVEPSLLWNPAVLAGIGALEDPSPLFQDMHSYLARAGITGVKVDCQAGVGMMGSEFGGGPAVAATYHASLERSVSQHFPTNDVINCMCHSTENIYRWRDTALARASDDFYPTDKASHLPHLGACCFNGLFLSGLALPDWDMFQSRHPAAEIHAAARAISGGPVYVSDSPGNHSFDLLKRLVLPDGTILRCQLPARPTRDSLFNDVMRDGQSLLKIWNLNIGTGVVGVFNIQGSSWDRARRRFVTHDSAPAALTTTVRVTDIESYRTAIEEAKSSVIDTTKSSSSSSKVVGVASNGTNKNNSSESESGESAVTRWLPWEADSWADIHIAATSSDANNGSDAGYASDMSGSSSGSTTRNGNGTRVQGVKTIPVHANPLGSWAAYVNTTHEVMRVKPDGGVSITLEGGQAAVVTFAPICKIFGVEFAPLGLANMYNGGGSILSTRVDAEFANEPAFAAVFGSGEGVTDSYLDLLSGESTVNIDDMAVPPPLPRFILTVKGRGEFVAYCSKTPMHCTVDGYAVPFSCTPTHKLTIDIPQIGKSVEQQLVIDFV